ncbi:hypothetical protein [Hansschlegelia sp. KR7-227]|uniref:hypothetical protein n=1 Tax=Hansschlegelia sp. KR7-227 TaxID=3400914 RepID=UPI003C068EAA
MIYAQFRGSQEKYAYFMLAASGACIAFAITRTQGDTLNYLHAIVGIGVLSWATSFYCGCQHLRYIGSATYANLDLLRIQAGRHPDVGNIPGYIEAASEGIQIAIGRNDKQSVRHAKAQFRLLILGAFLYLAWHVAVMYARSVG